jgi:hypothetical protein
MKLTLTNEEFLEIAKKAGAHELLRIRRPLDGKEDSCLELTGNDQIIKFGILVSRKILELSLLSYQQDADKPDITE